MHVNRKEMVVIQKENRFQTFEQHVRTALNASRCMLRT